MKPQWPQAHLEFKIEHLSDSEVKSHIVRITTYIESDEFEGLAVNSESIDVAFSQAFNMLKAAKAKLDKPIFQEGIDAPTPKEILNPRADLCIGGCILSTGEKDTGGLLKRNAKCIPNCQAIPDGSSTIKKSTIEAQIEHYQRQITDAWHHINKLIKESEKK